jgi:YbbR domain-containing protein
MLKNNRVVFILALIMAIALWAYVLGTVDPVRTVTLRDIPIRLLDQSELSDQDLVITSMDHEGINVTFTAKRSIANKIKADDFTAVADLRGIKLGDNMIKISVTRPSNITLESISSEYLNITTEQYITAEKEIEATIINPTKEETEPTIIKMSEDKVSVSGATTAVNKVKKVVAELDAGRMEPEPKSITAELKALDANGEQVEGVTLAFSNVTITAVLQSTREVPLEVPVSGQDSGSVNRTIKVPLTVIIKGDDDSINAVEKITCETVDLSDYYESAEVHLIPLLPDGVELSEDSVNPMAQVTVYNAGTVTLDFNENDINVTGIGSGRSARIANVNLKITVKGRSTVINALTKENFILSADVTGLEDGTNSVKLKAVCDLEGVDSVTAEPENVLIEIETI